MAEVIKKNTPKKFKSITKNEDGSKTIKKERAIAGVRNSAHSSVVKTKEKTKVGPFTKSKSVVTKAQNGVGDIATKIKDGKNKNIIINRQNYSDKSVLDRMGAGQTVKYSGNSKIGKADFKSVVKSAKENAMKNPNSYNFKCGGKVSHKKSCGGKMKKK